MRSRNIKPGFFINEKLSELTHTERLLYIGLWCFADCEGRFEWIPKRIEACIFPYDKGLKVDKMLCNLMSLHFIVKYQNKYGWIPKFLEHQRIHPHEAKSKIPAPSREIIEKYMSLQCNYNVSLNYELGIMNDECIGKEKTPPQEGKNPLVEKKVKHLDFVFLLPGEYLSLKERFKEKADELIENLNTYIGSKGDKYKSHYHTILMWERKNNTAKVPEAQSWRDKI